jgi:hypothetical protein
VSCWDRLIYGKGKTTKEKTKSLATPPYPHTHIFRTNEDMGHICTTFPPVEPSPHPISHAIPSHHLPSLSSPASLPTNPVQNSHTSPTVSISVPRRTCYTCICTTAHLTSKKKEKVLHVIFPDVAYAGTRCTGWCYWVQGSGRCPSVESG